MRDMAATCFSSDVACRVAGAARPYGHRSISSPTYVRLDIRDFLGIQPIECVASCL